MGVISILKTILEVIRAAREIIAFVEANKKEQWFQDSADVFADLRKAKTKEEKRRAAKGIRDLIGRS